MEEERKTNQETVEDVEYMHDYEREAAATHFSDIVGIDFENTSDFLVMRRFYEGATGKELSDDGKCIIIGACLRKAFMGIFCERMRAYHINGSPFIECLAENIFTMLMSRYIEKAGWKEAV